MSIESKRDKAVGPAPSDVQAETPAAWVSEMHVHFNQTGFYRVQDVQRVLGDPRQGVTIRPETDLRWASRVPKKRI
jgi:hypothetical protein